MATSNPGRLALVGAGEFLAPMAAVDRGLLAWLPARPRVAIVPTASAPDGPATFARWLALGEEHFAGLGADVDAIPLATRNDADDPSMAERLSRADLIYLSGGKPRYLLETLHDSPCWAAIQAVYARGGVIAGCSAGAMVLGGEMLAFPGRERTTPGLGLAPELLVIPHFGEFRIDLTALARPTDPRVVVVGIEKGTALVGRTGDWTVRGLGTVTVFAGPHRFRYAGDQAVLIPSSIPPF
jgi:cyanophycinase